MGLLRGRHDDDGTKYRIREKLLSIGDDSWIENEAGERAFKVNGKALRVRDTLVIEDPSGGELFSIQEKKLRIHDTMKIESGGQTVATVKKALITPLRDRYRKRCCRRTLKRAVCDPAEIGLFKPVVDHEGSIIVDPSACERRPASPAPWDS